MGLDTVELLMEVEDEFVISIPDRDAEWIRTMGQLHAYVCQAVRPRPAAWCESARGFYHFRRALLARCPEVARRAVWPGARVAHLLGGPNREQWEGLAGDVGLVGFYTFEGRAPLRFPAAYTTVRDLVRRMSRPAAYGWPPEDDFGRDVWVRVRRIVSEQMGVDEGELGPETHFIKDLGMG